MAERTYTKKRLNELAARGDLEAAAKLAQKLYGRAKDAHEDEREINTALARIQTVAMKLVRGYWSSTGAVATILLAEQQISGTRVRTIVAHAPRVELPQPLISPAAHVPLLFVEIRDDRI